MAVIAVAEVWHGWLKLQYRQGLDGLLGVSALSEDCMDIVGLMAVTVAYRELVCLLNEMHKENLYHIKRVRAFLKELYWPDCGFVDADVNSG